MLMSKQVLTMHNQDNFHQQGNLCPLCSDMHILIV